MLDGFTASFNILGDELHDNAKLLVMRRCWELLHDGVTPLQEDLRLLAADQPHGPLWFLRAVWNLGSGEDSWYEQQRQRYQQVMSHLMSLSDCASFTVWLCAAVLNTTCSELIWRLQTSQLTISAIPADVW